MTAFSPRLHAAAALVLGLLVVGLPLVALVLPAWQARVTFWERWGLLEEQFARYQSLSTQAPALKQSVARLIAQSTDRSGFLPEATTALAAAALQRKLQTLIETQGGQLQSAQSVPPSGESLFPAVTVRVQTNLSLEAVGPFFAALSQDLLLLEVDNVYLQTRYARGARPVGEGIPLLEVRLDVTGYLFEAEEP